MHHPPPGLTPLRDSDPRTIPPFTVHGRLGAGGMGVVYGATGPDGRWAAIKVVREEYAGEPEFRARFAAEIELMLRVRALCVAPVLAHDARAANPWYATAYLPGPTLARRVRVGGPLPAGQARVVAAGIAEAVAAIHAAGVVHRDLKPANVILAPDGPKVLDFGIARAADLTSHTRTGGLIGSPAWMSPERYRGDSGPEADVFAWGAVTVYTATGRSPFGEGGAETLMYRILNEEPDLAGLPEELADPVRRALAKDPLDRPRASELVHAVAGATREKDDTTIVSGLIRAHWDQGDTAPGGPPTGTPAAQAPTPPAGHRPPPVPGGPPPHGPAQSHGSVPPHGSAPLPNPWSASATPPPPPRRKRRVWPLALGAGALVVTLVGGVGLVASRLGALGEAEWGDTDEGSVEIPLSPTEEPHTLSGALVGSGSTMVGPYVDIWAEGYLDRQPDVEVLYDPTGSGAGAQEFTEGGVDFGVSENPLTEEQQNTVFDARGCPPVALPVAAGAVAVIYNIEGVDELYLSADALASVFSGETTDYADLGDHIAEGANTPLQGAVTAVRHDDEAATAQVFERYLETAPAWGGAWGESVLAGVGDNGVYQTVSETPGAIGFVNASFAQQLDLPIAGILTEDGGRVMPDEEGANAAAEQIDLFEDDFSLTGRVTGRGYPIMRVSHLFAHGCGYEDETAAALRDFLSYALGEEGAVLLAEEGYTPLPPSVVEGVTERIVLIDSY